MHIYTHDIYVYMCTYIYIWQELNVYYLAKSDPKKFKAFNSAKKALMVTYSERERERVCVCVCVCACAWNKFKAFTVPKSSVPKMVTYFSERERECVCVWLSEWTGVWVCVWNKSSSKLLTKPYIHVTWYAWDVIYMTHMYGKRTPSMVREHILW